MRDNARSLTYNLGQWRIQYKACGFRVPSVDSTIDIGTLTKIRMKNFSKTKKFEYEFLLSSRKM